MMKINNYCDDIVHVVTCTKIGTEHFKCSIPNQDSIQFKKNEDGSLYLAVADGVSSSKNSKEGSKVAVDTVKELLDSIRNGELEICDIDTIRKYVVKQWKSKFVSDWNEYATTLNFILVVNNDVLVGQIGDGLIALNIDEQEYLYAENDTFYSSETFALSEVVLKKTFVIDKYTYKDSVSAIMASDGIGKEIEAGSQQDLLDYLVRLIRQGELKVNRELNTWIDILEKKNGDDKSLGILVLEG